MLEKTDTLGGTWRDNVYPGCACDVESHTCSFSFFPATNWTRTFARRSEIGPTWRTSPTTSGCGTASVQRPRHRRRVGRRGPAGRDARRRQRATCPLRRVQHQRPARAGPSDRGPRTVRQTAFHSRAVGPHGDLRGKRVTVIRDRCLGHPVRAGRRARDRALTLFQRTAPWVLPKPGPPDPASAPGARSRRVPGLRRAYRTALYWRHEALVVGFPAPEDHVGGRAGRPDSTCGAPSPVTRSCTAR
ncbi:hypothetical protein HBB16_16820 [Pseudonocardia sp. MCCB 268]|nr:hypothetical protein [Pseudonocardia cytotoxica]